MPARASAALGIDTSARWHSAVIVHFLEASRRKTGHLIDPRMTEIVSLRLGAICEGKRLPLIILSSPSLWRAGEKRCPRFGVVAGGERVKSAGVAAGALAFMGGPFHTKSHCR